MNPAAPSVLHAAGRALLERVAPEIRAPFGQATAGMAGTLAIIAAQEFDRAADRLHTENEAVAAILLTAAPLLHDAALRERVAIAAADRKPPDLRVSTLQAINDRLRAILIEVHEAIEETPGPEAAAMDVRIWTELRESVRRRHVEVPK